MNTLILLFAFNSITKEIIIYALYTNKERVNQKIFLYFPNYFLLLYYLYYLINNNNNNNNNKRTKSAKFL